MFEISSSPVRAVSVTPQVMSVPAFVMNIFEPFTTQLAVAQLGGRQRVARVGAGAGLGQPEGCELAAGSEVGQPLALLLLAPEQVDRHRPERGVRRDGDRDGRVDPRQLLDRERIGDRVAAGAAVLLGDRQAHHSELAELRDELVREARLPVELLRHRSDLLACELAHRVAYELLLLGQVEVHARPDATG